MFYKQYPPEKLQEIRKKALARIGAPVPDGESLRGYIGPLYRVLYKLQLKTEEQQKLKDALIRGDITRGKATEFTQVHWQASDSCRVLVTDLMEEIHNRYQGANMLFWALRNEVRRELQEKEDAV